MIEFEFSDETDDVVCECCEGRSDIGIRRIMFNGFSCQHCFYVWYEYGLTDPVKVRAESLKRQAVGKKGGQ